MESYLPGLHHFQRPDFFPSLFFLLRESFFTNESLSSALSSLVNSVPYLICSEDLLSPPSCRPPPISYIRVSASSLVTLCVCFSLPRNSGYEGTARGQASAHSHANPSSHLKQRSLFLHSQPKATLSGLQGQDACWSHSLRRTWYRSLSSASSRKTEAAGELPCCLDTDSLGVLCLSLICKKKVPPQPDSIPCPVHHWILHPEQCTLPLQKFAPYPGGVGGKLEGCGLST